jgi:hypothetical protein
LIDESRGFGLRLNPILQLVWVYTIHPIFENEKPTLEVEAEFEGSDEEITEIVLPSSWAGQEKLYQQLPRSGNNARTYNTAGFFIKCRIYGGKHSASLMRGCEGSHLYCRYRQAFLFSSQPPFIQFDYTVYQHIFDPLGTLIRIFR